MLRDKRVLILLSFVVAVGLWVYVMGNKDPETTQSISGVQIEMEGNDFLEEQGLTAVLNNPKMLRVTIEGKRSQINKVKKQGLEAYIDVSTCDYGRNETEIYVRLPEGVTGVSIESISEKTAVFTVGDK